MTTSELGDPAENHWVHQSDPRAYVVNVTEALRQISDEGLTQSQKIVRALQIVCPEVATKGFRKRVQEAMYIDAIGSDYTDPGYTERLIARAERRFGKHRARKFLFDRSEVLQTWKNRDAKFVPDAYLIDKSKKTVVCYEVEDHHPLNPFSIGEYAAAWWTLEYIYWDLHLIAYDVFGNPRIIAFPSSEFIAYELRKIRRRPPAEDS